MVCAASACSVSSHSTEPTAAGPGASWTTYHEDAEATGVQPAQLQLLPSQEGLDLADP